MHAEGGEGAGVFTQGFGDGQGGVDFRVFGNNVIGVLGEAQGEEIVFQGRNAVQAPGGVGDGLHELFFDHAFRLQVVEETLGEALVGGEVLGGEDDGVAGEAVPNRL